MRGPIRPKPQIPYKDRYEFKRNSQINKKTSTLFNKIMGREIWKAPDGNLYYFYDKKSCTTRTHGRDTFKTCKDEGYARRYFEYGTYDGQPTYKKVKLRTLVDYKRYASKTPSQFTKIHPYTNVAKAPQNTPTELIHQYGDMSSAFNKIDQARRGQNPELKGDHKRIIEAMITIHDRYFNTNVSNAYDQYRFKMGLYHLINPKYFGQTQYTQKVIDLFKGPMNSAKIKRLYDYSIKQRREVITAGKEWYERPKGAFVLGSALMTAGAFAAAAPTGTSATSAISAGFKPITTGLKGAAQIAGAAQVLTGGGSAGDKIAAANTLATAAGAGEAVDAVGAAAANVLASSGIDTSAIKETVDTIKGVQSDVIGVQSDFNEMMASIAPHITDDQRQEFTVMANQLKAEGKTDSQIAGAIVNSSEFRQLASQVASPVVERKTAMAYYNYLRRAGYSHDDALKWANYYGANDGRVMTQRATTEIVRRGPGGLDLTLLMALLPAAYFALR